MSADTPRPPLSWLRLPLSLAATLLVVFFATLAFTPAGKLNWLLEVGPGVFGMAALALTYRRLPMSRFVYVAVFLHVLVLVYGGFYTYARAPFGEWLREVFHFQRNPYDKIGHFAFGLFPVFVLREVLLRVTALRPGGWLNFLLVSSILGFAAEYELFEWAAASVLDPAGGDAFLGTQGDVWDAQSDMLWAGIGAVTGLLTLRRLHDASMARLVTACSHGAMASSPH